MDSWERLNDFLTTVKDALSNILDLDEWMPSIAKVVQTHRLRIGLLVVLLVVVASTVLFITCHKYGFLRVLQRAGVVVLIGNKIVILVQFGGAGWQTARLFYKRGSYRTLLTLLTGASLSLLLQQIPGLLPKAENGVAENNPSPEGHPSIAELFERGDLDKIADEALQGIDEQEPDQLVVRASVLWLRYLQANRGRNSKARLDIRAEQVQRGLDDLEKALSIRNHHHEALFLRAGIHEMTGDLVRAVSDYTEGLNHCPEQQRERFETALIALELQRGQ